MWRPTRTDLRGFHAQEGELTANPAESGRAGEDVIALMPTVFISDL